MGILRYFSEAYIFRSHVDDENPDQLVQATVEATVEEIVFELPPEVFDVHGCS
jgi:hypothetical protein